MRVTYRQFMEIQAEMKGLVLRQFMFVALPVDLRHEDADRFHDPSPVFPGPDRVWAVVDDPEVIAQKRVYIPAEDLVYIAGVSIRIDYDPVLRPTLILHDVV